MGKKEIKAVEPIQPERESECGVLVIEEKKKSLDSYLPYKKYVTLKQKKLKNIRKSMIGHLGIDKFQVEKAVHALQNYNQANGPSNNLFEDSEEGFLYLEIVLSEVPAEYSIRPIQISLPFPIYSK